MLISIVVPIYNSSKYLNECLNSIVNQTYLDYECIMINDGSTDNSEKICRVFVKKDSRFKLFSQVNRGLSNARNRGLMEAKGDYILFVDSDDFLISTALEQLAKEITEDKDIIFFDYMELKSGILRKKVDVEILECIENPSYFQYIQHFPYIYKKNGDIDYRKGGFFSSVWRTIIKRNILLENKVFFDEALICGEDREFIKTVIKYCKQRVYYPRHLYVYRIHNESLMHINKDKMEPKAEKSIQDYLKEYQDELERRKDRYSNLSLKLRQSAINGYKYQVASMMLQYVGRNISQLDVLLKDSFFNSCFTWKYILKQNSGKERIVLILYKLKLYKLVLGRKNAK